MECIEKINCELNKMNNKEKFIIRSSILELAETGTPRNISIDDRIKNNNNHNEREKEKYIKLLGLL